MEMKLDLVTTIFLIVFYILERIVESFIYMSFILIPVLVGIIVIGIKIKHEKKENIDNNKINKHRRIIGVLILTGLISFIIGLFYGYKIFGYVISLNLGSKKSVIEKKLEKKYNKNFTYVNKKSINVDEDANSALGDFVLYNYSLNYVFKDDDGVYAPVTWYYISGSDYYESKRSKYDIEQTIYNYAKKKKFNKDFYVFVESPSERIDSSDLNEKPKKNYISKKRKYNRIDYILKDESDDNREMIINALSQIDTSGDFIIKEYIVTNSEYNKIVSFYNNINKNPGIEGEDYDSDYNYDNVIYNDYYYYSWGIK